MKAFNQITRLFRKQPSLFILFSLFQFCLNTDLGRCNACQLSYLRSMLYLDSNGLDYWAR